MIPEVKRMWIINDVVDFVNRFGLRREFKRRFGKSIDEWDFELSDDEVIEEFLKDWKGIYFLTFDEHTEQFILYELEDVEV